jgi:predicted permease
MGRDVALMVAVAGAFPNSGNYGIPLVEFAFGPVYVPPQAVITTLHLILILFTGPLLLSETRLSPGAILRDLFKTPLIPAVLVGIGLNAAAIELPPPIARPLEILGAAYIPLALFVLGAQMRGVRLGGVRVALGTASLLRLVVAPLATWAALMTAGLPAATVSFLTVGATAPVGVLLPVLAVEYGRRGELSSAAVLVTTVLSPLAATAAVVLLRISGG